MNTLKDKALSDARTFFSTELRTVLVKHQLTPKEESVEYIVDLLLRYMESKHFFVEREDGKLDNNFLVELYGEYIHGDIHKKKVVLQRLGDVCLLISGFFAESLQRKVFDIGYYFGMGGTAYKTLADLQRAPGPREMYSELSYHFKPFSNVLNEMSERSGINSNSDILRLYERWISTGSERLKNVLQEHGISAPIIFDPKQKH